MTYIHAAANKSSSLAVNTKRSFMQEYLIMPKLLYFFLNMTVYTLHTFSTQFFVEMWGLKIHEVSYVSALAGVNFFGALLWTNLADKTGKHKTILIGSNIVFTFFFCLLGIRVFQGPEQVIYRSIWTASAFALGNFFMAALFPLLDAQVLSMLSKEPGFSKEKFGHQRLFSSFGHVTVSLLAAGAQKWLGWTGVFILLIINSSLFILCIVFGISNDIVVEKGVRHGHGHGSDDKKTAVHVGEVSVESTRSPAMTLLTNMNFLFFMLVVLVAGHVRSVMTYFQSYLVESGCHREKWEAALVQAARVGPEVAIYFFGKQILGFFGAYWVLIASQVVGILRVLGYALMLTTGNSGYYASYFLELIKGLNTGLMVSSAVRIASDIAPQGCANTAQGLFSGNYSGMATTVGGVVGGLMIYYSSGVNDIAKIQDMFLWTVYLSGALTVLFALKYGLIDRVLGLPGMPAKRSAPGGPAH